MAILKLETDFYNKFASEIQETYFPDIKYYGDNEKCAKGRYSIECFSNGVLNFDKMISQVAKYCKANVKEVEDIANKYIRWE